MKIKIKKGDTVEMRSGKDRGKRGKILAVLGKKGRVVVEGLNLVRKHKRPKKAGQTGEMVQVARPVDIAKVMLVCSQCGRPTRVGFKVDGSNRVRVCKKCGAQI